VIKSLKGLLRDLAEQALTAALEHVWEMEDDVWPPEGVSPIDGVDLEDMRPADMGPGVIECLPIAEAPGHYTAWFSRHVPRDDGSVDLLAEVMRAYLSWIEAKIDGEPTVDHRIDCLRAANEYQMIAMGWTTWWEEM
jgi:hypothetical protein